MQRHKRTNLFPYTTLFRSGSRPAAAAGSCRRKTRRGCLPCPRSPSPRPGSRDRKSTRLNSSHVASSYAVFYLKKKQHDPIRLFTQRRIDKKAVDLAVTNEI